MKNPSPHPSDSNDAIPCYNCIKVILKDQEPLLELIDKIPYENSRRTCLLKLRDSLEVQSSKQENNTTPKIYSFKDILNWIHTEIRSNVFHI